MAEGLLVSTEWDSNPQQECSCSSAPCCPPLLAHNIVETDITVTIAMPKRIVVQRLSKNL
jgi:hypothetical protein